MKIKHAVIASVVFFISAIIVHEAYPIELELRQLLTSVLALLWLASLGLIAYLIIRNIFRAIKGAAVGAPKQKQDTAPPWEK